MSRSTNALLALMKRFPRSRGDEPSVGKTVDYVLAFSPLTRG